MSIKVLPYKAGSQSAKALAEGLGIKRLKLQGSRWRGKVGDIIINWGNSAGTTAIGNGKFLNQPAHVAVAANKLHSQRAFEGSPYCLPFVTTKREAERLIDAGHTIVCRTKLTGNSGEGIVIAETKEQLVNAPLYTSYVKKTDEYRVHIFKGKVISVQRKARKRDVADDQVNWKVRNLEGGFIFARTGFQVPQSVVDAAEGAMRDLKLDFGAVDIGFHKKEGTYVYEVNTACGLDGSNLTDYIEAFCDELGLDKPERPEDYVPPTLPNQPQREPAPMPEQPAEIAAVLSNEDVINILKKYDGEKVPAIREVVGLTNKGLRVAKDMVDRAANTIAARKAAQVREAVEVAPEPEPVVEEIEIVKEDIIIGGKFFVKYGLPLGDYTDEDEQCYVSRQMAFLSGKEITVLGLRNDEYDFNADRWAWCREWVYKEGEDPIYHGHKARPVNPEDIVPARAKANPVPAEFKAGEVPLGKGDITFTAGNFARKLTPEQQIKLVAAIRKL